MTVLEFLLDLQSRGWLLANEDGRPPSRSEVRRWFERKSVWGNGHAIDPDVPIDWLCSLVLFPKGRRRVTLW